MAITVSISSPRSELPTILKPIPTEKSRITIRVGSKTPVLEVDPAVEPEPEDYENLVMEPEPKAPGKITIKVKAPTEPEKKMTLLAKKTIANDILIFDHADIDIILKMEGKVIAIMKHQNSEVGYLTQKRLFDYLFRRGVIEYDSIQGGKIYGTMEATVSGHEIYSDALALCFLNIAKWINEEERDYLDALEKSHDDWEDEMLNPNGENSTELGEVPAEKQKGTNPTDPSNQYGINLYRAQWGY